MTLERTSASGSPIEILDRVLDKGIVIDASVRVALVGIEVLGMDARVVVASFETYMRHADAIAGTGLAAAPVAVPSGATLRGSVLSAAAPSAPVPITAEKLPEAAEPGRSAQTPRATAEEPAAE
jgi:gas vesicle structural protein